MAVCEQLEADHAEIAALFDQLAPLASDEQRAEDAQRLALRLAIAIKTQALAEERVVYEALRTASDRLAELAREGPHAHHALDVVLDKLLALRPGAELRAAVAVARRLWEHQIAHERRELLPAVIEALPADERAQLGRDLRDEQARLRPQIARRTA